MIKGMPSGLADRHWYASAYLDWSCVLRAGVQLLQVVGLSWNTGMSCWVALDKVVWQLPKEKPSQASV